MNFPALSIEERVAKLMPPTGELRMVLDTDTYNEVDDQFAVAHALMSREKLHVEAIYAAPFFNHRSSGPGDGMEKSFAEILRLLQKLDRSPDNFVYKGSRKYLKNEDSCQESDAARDLVARACSGGTLYVAAIGAITNVASAILMEPDIIKNIVVVWLGGNALYWSHAREFNLQQDVAASRIIFDSGVPLVQIPCLPIASHLQTTVPELESCLNDVSDIGTYLTDTVKDYNDNHFGWSKVIWDISATAWLVEPSWVPTVLEHSPILTDQLTWSVDASRHLIRTAVMVDRDAIFRDVFSKLAE